MTFFCCVAFMGTVDSHDVVAFGNSENGNMGMEYGLVVDTCVRRVDWALLIMCCTQWLYSAPTAKANFVKQKIQLYE